ncbi:hypothetical protein H7H37_21145 [Mycolicibacterium insubricum]|nr:hypothetical protein [Mycolicibacterium insubricum]
MAGSIPAKGAVPAVWWITTDADQCGAYDRWKADYQTYTEKVERLAESIGLTVDAAIMWESFDGTSTLCGFRPPNGMGVGWSGHPNYRPVPDGWRIDSRKDLLVPSRKTKADRESQANKDFAAAGSIPDAHAYLTGLPTSIHLDDRFLGGTIYPVHYRRGAECVWAYCGGDPDRQPDRSMNDTVDESIWQRMKLSVLVALMEEPGATS